MDSGSFEHSNPFNLNDSLDDADLLERPPFLLAMKEALPPFLLGFVYGSMPMVAGGFICSTVAALALRFVQRRHALLIADLFNAFYGPFVRLFGLFCLRTCLIYLPDKQFRAVSI